MSSLGVSSRSLSYLRSIFSNNRETSTSIKQIPSRSTSTASTIKTSSKKSLRVTEQAVQSLIDMMYVLFKAFASLGTVFKCSYNVLNSDLQQVYDNICQGNTSATYFELLNDPDLLWSTLLKCIGELNIFGSEEAMRLVSSSDEETIVITAQLSLPLRRLLGALLCGLSLVLNDSHVAVSVSLLNALNAVLFPSLDDKDCRLQALFNLASNAATSLYYYEPFAVRLGVRLPPNPEVHWRMIQRRLDQELDHSPRPPPPISIPTTTSLETAAPLTPQVESKYQFTLKGASVESLRDLFTKCLSAEETSTGIDPESRVELG